MKHKLAQLKRKHSSKENVTAKEEGTAAKRDDDDLGEDFFDVENEDYVLDQASSEDESDVEEEDDDDQEEGEEDVDEEESCSSEDDDAESNEYSSDEHDTMEDKRESNDNGNMLSGIEPKSDEYADHDTSDEEDIRNTVGNIPMKWYDEYRHLGYDWDGQQIIKPPTGDQLDTFLKKVEDPDFWRTVKDPQTGQDVVLSEEDIETIRRIQGKKIPNVNFDEYAVSFYKCYFLNK